jgi:hypothetical protein
MIFFNIENKFKIKQILNNEIEKKTKNERKKKNK